MSGRSRAELSQLRAGYSWKVRSVEYFGLTAYAISLGCLVARLLPHVLAQPWLALAAAMLGFLAADFVSGFVHWLADTWGSTQMRWIGQSLIRPFREHHIDQKEITRHDFVETNGNNCLISVPVIVIALFLPLEDWGGQLAAEGIASLVVWVMATNQFHKWAHLDEPRGLVAWLQKCHLILPPAHHALHHQAPYTDYYCITAGWLNLPLKWIRFYRVLEKTVSATIGLVPREEDLALPVPAASPAPGSETISG